MSDDLISRQAAIEAIEKSMYENPHENEIHRGMHDHEHRHFLTILMGLPSAQPATNCSEIPNGSDDTISRQAAIDAVLDRMNVEKHGRDAKPEEIQWTLEKLPSAQPERKKGKWIDAVVGGELPVIVCDQCNTFFPLQFGDSHNFCPNCGARMKGADDED